MTGLDYIDLVNRFGVWGLACIVAYMAVRLSGWYKEYRHMGSTVEQHTGEIVSMKSDIRLGTERYIELKSEFRTLDVKLDQVISEMGRQSTVLSRLDERTLRMPGGRPADV